MAEMECGENGGLDGIEFRAGAMLPNLGDLDDLPLVAPVKELVVAWPSTGGGRDTVVAVRRGAPDTESARTRTGGRSVRVCAGVGTAGDACETGVERR